MERIKTVGIRELKNKLSEYLRAVQMGTRFLVTDRNIVVGELLPPRDPAQALADQTSGIRDDWVRGRKVILPQAKKSPLGSSPIKLAKPLANELIDRVRGS